MTCNKIAYIKHCYHGYISYVDRIEILIRHELITVLFILVMVGSQYKTNCDFEMPILHYIGIVGRKSILIFGLRRFATPPNTRIFFSRPNKPPI